MLSQPHCGIIIGNTGQFQGSCHNTIALKQDFAKQIQALIKDKHDALKQIQSRPTLGSEDALGSSPGSGAGLEYSPESKPWPSFALPAKEKNKLRKTEEKEFQRVQNSLPLV